VDWHSKTDRGERSSGSLLALAKSACSTGRHAVTEHGQLQGQLPGIDVEKAFGFQHCTSTTGENCLLPHDGEQGVMLGNSPKQLLPTFLAPLFA